MPAKSGYYPWKEFDSEGNALSIIQGRDGMEYDISSGWHYKRPKGWTKNVKREQVEMIDFQGKVHKVYRYDIPESIVGFRAHEGNNSQRQEMLAKMNDAFSDKAAVMAVEGCGHIKLLEYVEKSRILRVTFTNNSAVCVYFDVPTFVAGRLFYFALHKDTMVITANGRRHKLGVEFWDLIRIRGHQHGAKFPFEYVSHGTGTIQHSNRHIVKIPGYGPMMTVLNDQEFKANLVIENILSNLQQLKNKYTGLEASSKQDKHYDEEGNLIKAENTERSADDQLTIEEVRKSIAHIKNYIRNSALGQMMERAEKYLEDIINTDAYQEMYGDIANDRAAREEFIRNERSAIPELELMDARVGSNSDRPFKYLRNLSTRKEFFKYQPYLERFDDDHVYSWLLKGNQYRTRGSFGRGWTEEDLIKERYKLDKDQESIYKTYLDRKDWHGALTFLKGTAKRGTYKDSASGFRKAVESEKIAGERDFLVADFENEENEDE